MVLLAIVQTELLVSCEKQHVMVVVDRWKELSALLLKKEKDGYTEDE